MSIAYRVLWIIALGILIGLCGCARKEMTPFNQDASRPGHFNMLTRTSLGSDEWLSQIEFEGHHLIVYDGYSAGAMIHSPSCPHPVHNDMREIY